jgi:hypothetical protein
MIKSLGNEERTQGKNEKQNGVSGLALSKAQT